MCLQTRDNVPWRYARSQGLPNGAKQRIKFALVRVTQYGARLSAHCAVQR